MTMKASITIYTLIVVALLAGQVTEAGSKNLMFYHSCPNHRDGTDLFAARPEAAERLAPEQKRMKRDVLTEPLPVNVGDKYIIDLLNSSYQISQNFSCILTFKINTLQAPPGAGSDDPTIGPNEKAYLQYTMSDWKIDTCDVEIDILLNENKVYYFSCDENIETKEKMLQQTLTARTFAVTDRIGIRMNVVYNGTVITASKVSAQITIEMKTESATSTGVTSLGHSQILIGAATLGYAMMTL